MKSTMMARLGTLLTISILVACGFLVPRAFPEIPAVSDRTVSPVQPLPESDDLVSFTNVKVCACVGGVEGYLQKKVKMKVTNTSSDLTLQLAADPMNPDGQSGQIYLLVAYPDDFEPNTVTPAQPEGGWDWSQRSPDSMPPMQSMAYTGVDEVTAMTEVSRDQLEELNQVPDGWKIYAVPASPNRAAMLSYDQLPGTDSINLTYPTFLKSRELAPGEDIYQPELGLGNWVFHIPVADDLWEEYVEFYEPEVIFDPTDSRLDGIEKFEGTLDDLYSPFRPSETDPHHLILGVAAILGEDHIVGYSPAPPVRAWTNGSEF